MYWRDCSDCHLIFTDILPIGDLYVLSSLYEAPNNETDKNMNLYPHLQFTAQAYVTGWRVRGESVGGQGGESVVSLGRGCETVSPSTVHCAGLRDRVESQR